MSGDAAGERIFSGQQSQAAPPPIQPDLALDVDEKIWGTGMSLGELAPELDVDDEFDGV